MAKWEILELHMNSGTWVTVVDEIVRIEKRVFPKHESLAKSFQVELKKKNVGLLYARAGGEVAGYVMYSWPSSLSASITKLAVMDKYRRQGLGEALLRASLERCKTRNIHCISLHVDPSRCAAMNLYKKLGFQTATDLSNGVPPLARKVHQSKSQTGLHFTYWSNMDFAVGMGVVAG